MPEVIDPAELSVHDVQGLLRRVTSMAHPRAGVWLLGDKPIKRYDSVVVGTINGFWFVATSSSAHRFGRLVYFLGDDFYQYPPVAAANGRYEASPQDWESRITQAAYAGQRRPDDTPPLKWHVHIEWTSYIPGSARACILAAWLTFFPSFPPRSDTPCFEFMGDWRRGIEEIRRGHWSGAGIRGVKEKGGLADMLLFEEMQKRTRDLMVAEAKMERLRRREVAFRPPEKLPDNVMFRVLDALGKAGDSKASWNAVPMLDDKINGTQWQIVLFTEDKAYVIREAGASPPLIRRTWREELGPRAVILRSWLTQTPITAPAPAKWEELHLDCKFVPSEQWAALLLVWLRQFSAKEAVECLGRVSILPGKVKRDLLDFLAGRKIEWRSVELRPATGPPEECQKPVAERVRARACKSERIVR